MLTIAIFIAAGIPTLFGLLCRAGMGIEDMPTEYL